MRCRECEYHAALASCHKAKVRHTCSHEALGAYGRTICFGELPKTSKRWCPLRPCNQQHRVVVAREDGK